MNTAKRIMVMSQMAEAFQEVMASANLDDDVAVRFSALYPDWEPNCKRKEGQVLNHNGQLYRVTKNVNKNNTVEPGTEEGAAYYTPITVSESGYEEWKQPSTKKEAYSKGHIVSHNGQNWVSTANNNMDEPGTSDTWQIYEEE